MRARGQQAQGAPSTAATAPAATGIEAFSFGDPTPVLEHADILDCFECWKNGHWYEPPVNLAGLAKSFNAGVHHSSAMWPNKIFGSWFSL